MEGKEDLQEKEIPCAYCEGRGRECGLSLPCITCKGKGINVVYASSTRCTLCNGRGRVRGTALYCLSCRGVGVALQAKNKGIQIKTSLIVKEGTGGKTSWIKNLIKSLCAAGNKANEA